MAESLLMSAFFFGIVSAASLPLGSLTVLVWRPGDRMVAFLLAFGGGALLAALAVDLVARAVDAGHHLPLAVGCVLGGALFVSLNQIVNSQGGFLRKSSTLIYYMQRRRRHMLYRVLGSLGRIRLFETLPAREAEDLAGSAVLLSYPADHTVYRIGDPADHLFIVKSGTVDLFDGTDAATVTQAGPLDTFGRMAFLAGAPHALCAVTRTETRVWAIPREDLESLLVRSPHLRAAMAAFLETGELESYLTRRHAVPPQELKTWREESLRIIGRGGLPGEAVEIERRAEHFMTMAYGIQRAPIFAGLPDDDLAEIASDLFSRTYEKGETIFHHAADADRFFIVEDGEVVLVDPADHGAQPVTVGGGDAFGAMSFLTGSRHTVSAVATAPTRAWVMRRREFDRLIRRMPQLDRQVARFLQDAGFPEYLERKHNLRAKLALKWMNQAVKNLDAGRLLPQVADLKTAGVSHGGVPLAIWLGILLDGIPESLVIGASVGHQHFSMSLIAGLFFSNYPEALSSSSGMREQGYSPVRVIGMWTALMLITGVGAALGSLYFSGADPADLALIEGLAAGAMLTMVAETMLPEAYFKGGSIVGLSTLTGFLAAIMFH
ncbi:MAG: cyclic nucleotide-binding domain-containing protein [Alphaproteobacteria bacterium]|nr:cyclic nucleotide-binding domain-containing protein [Alphaproteobacteria bacterium]